MLFKCSTTAPSPTAPRYESLSFCNGLFARGLTAQVARARFGLLCLLLVLCARHSALAQGGYTITDLGIGNQWYSEAHGLNNNGWAVGEYEPVGALYQHGFLYNGQTTSGLSIFPDVYGIAWGVNDSNLIVGEYVSNPNPMFFIIEAFTYSNGAVTGLGFLSSSSYSSAHAINRAGQIVGESSTNSTGSVIHAILWDNGSKVDLGVLSGYYSSANAINNSGIIVGESSVEGTTNSQAFIYTNTITPLGTLGGDYSSAKGINDAGVVVGESTEVIGGVTNLQGFIYRNGSMSSFRAQAAALGADSSSISAINNSGQIVGALGFGQLTQAFLVDGTNIVNLNQYIPPSSGFTNLSSADGINDKGQIIGSGNLANGDYHGYLLTPSKPWILLSALPQGASTGFQVNIKGMSGAQFIVQASTDLSASNWVSLYTNVLIGSETNFTDTYSANWTTRYYRALLLQ
jgi:probable HAF family extracellular repeat protein